MLRIIDNKRIELTSHEWTLYQEICKAYDDERLGIKGVELFSGLFETDKEGAIIFLRPPTSKYSSMEVYMFLVTIMVHQHVGSACEYVDQMVKRLDEKMKEVDSLIEKCNTTFDDK